MLWILISLVFIGCAAREIYRSVVAAPGYEFPTPISKPYLAIVLALATLFAWPPIHVWHFQRFLSATATQLAENHGAKVHCNTILGPRRLDTVPAQFAGDINVGDLLGVVAIGGTRCLEVGKLLGGDAASFEDIPRHALTAADTSRCAGRGGMQGDGRSCTA